MANLARRNTDRMPVRRSEDIFTSLRKEMDRVFDDFRTPFDLLPFSGNATVGGWSPMMNVQERGNDILITVDVPGVDEKDIEIVTDKDTITVRGHKHEESRDETPNYHMLERSFGSFERTVALPIEIDANKAEAKFKNGVLEICLPKTETARTNLKKIPIKGESDVRTGQASVTQQSKQPEQGKQSDQTMKEAAKEETKG
jgi:HSP20 family protein